MLKKLGSKHESSVQDSYKQRCTMGIIIAYLMAHLAYPFLYLTDIQIYIKLFIFYFHVKK